MAKASITNRAKTHIFLGFCGSDNFCKCFVFRARMRCQHHGGCADHDHRGQVFFAVKRHAGGEAWINAKCVKHHSKCVAICRCLHHSRGTDRAGSATAVFHNHALAQLLRQRLRNDARYLVYGPARWKHGHQTNGLARGPCLRQSQHRGTQSAQQCGEA